MFRDILEEGGHWLAGRRPMSNLIPFILNEEKLKIKEEISGKDVRVIYFDGTSRLGNSSATIFGKLDFNTKTDWFTASFKVYMW